MKRLKLILISTCFCSLAIAQNVSLQGIIPPSPEAAALGKYGTYPVGYFTGKPDINVPIYEIKTKNFTIPITLNYDATGIKVDDIATNVGMNWSLIAGGMISRTVQIMPDEESYGYLQNPPPRVADITNTPAYLDYIKHLNRVANSAITYDTEPDKYNYNIPGKSGSFTFKSDKSIMQIPQTSARIVCDFTNFKFKIIDENGVTFLFNAPERTQVWTGSSSSDSDIKNITTGWYLTEMISNDQTEHVYFNYTDDYTGPIRTNNFTDIYMGPGWTFDERLKKFWNGMERTIYSKRLTSIKFATGKIEFTNATSRSDDLGTRLDEITVFSSTDTTNYTKLRSYKLYQGYYTSTIPYATTTSIYDFNHTDADYKRLRLDSLGIKDANSAIISKYKFFYNTNMLPPKSSLGQDLWGYFNGQTNNTTLVRSTIVPYALNGFPYPVAIGGANREADETSMKAGILEKVVYPTGGYTVFEMEPHKYHSDYGLPVSANISAGAQGKDYSGAVHQQTVSFTAGTEITSSAATLTISFGPYVYEGNPPYIYSPDQEHNLGIPPFVRIRDLTTSTETVYTNPDPTQNYSQVIPYYFSPHDYEITAYNFVNQDGTYSGISVNYNTFTAGQTVTVGGLRTKSIKNYDFNNALSSQENFKYGESEDGLGKLVSAEVHSNVYTTYSTMYDPHVGGPIYDGTTIRDIYPSGPVFDLLYLQGSPVVYGYVTKYNGDASNNIGKTVYHYKDDYLFTSRPFVKGRTILNNTGILVTNDYWKRGNLIYQQDYKLNSDLTYTPVSKITNTYRDTITTSTYGFVTGVETFLSPINNNLYQLYHFQYDEIAINTGYVQLLQTKKEDFYPGPKTVTATNDYTYDLNHNDFKATSTFTNSSGQVIKDFYKYPFNKSQLLNAGSLSSTESMALDTMVLRNIIAPVVEQSRYNNGNFLQASQTTYGFWAGNNPSSISTFQLYPTGAKTLRAGYSYEPRLQYLNYDEKGNILTQGKVGANPSVFIWSYNRQYPIAKIDNANYATVISELGGQTTVDTWAATALPTNSQIATYLAPLRISSSLKGALVTTYTYSPLGITTSTDAKGQTTSYEYDSFQRLKDIKDKDGNIVKHTDYNYQH